MKTLVFLAVLACIAFAQAFPAADDNGHIISKRSPARIMMLSGFYRANRRQGYVGEVPASECKSCGGDVEEPVINEEPDAPEDAPLEQLPEEAKKEEPEDELEDEPEDEPVKRPAKGRGNVNTFFPIQFSGARAVNGAYPGAVAIANSFSTGKRGVAKSVATAYGQAPPQ